MIPALAEFFRRLLFDKGAFLLWSRALMMALAQFGMMYSSKLSAMSGIDDGTIEVLAGVLSGAAILLPAGDKTTPEKVTAALAKAADASPVDSG